MLVSPEDDGVNEGRVSKEDGRLGVGADGHADGPVFEMDADQEVREMEDSPMTGRTPEWDGRR